MISAQHLLDMQVVNRRTAFIFVSLSLFGLSPLLIAVPSRAEESVHLSIQPPSSANEAADEDFVEASQAIPDGVAVTAPEISLVAPETAVLPEAAETRSDIFSAWEPCTAGDTQA